MSAQVHSRLWLLRPLENLAPEENPWEFCFGTSQGFIVRADSETEARKIANIHGSLETERGVPDPWIREDKSSCVELTGFGEKGIVMEDNAGG